jgi:hypothetical protein
MKHKNSFPRTRPKPGLSLQRTVDFLKQDERGSFPSLNERCYMTFGWRIGDCETPDVRRGRIEAQCVLIVLTEMLSKRDLGSLGGSIM